MRFNKQTEEKRQAIIAFIKEQGVVSIRQIFYRLVSQNIIKNTLSQYQMLDNFVNKLRYEGIIPFNSISDITNCYGTNQYDSIQACVEDAVEDYRSNWNKKFNTYIEVWCEKEALTNILYPITNKYGVTLNPCKGISKVTQVYKFLERSKGYKEYVILYLGDFDPTGIHISNEVLPEQFRKQDGNVEIKRIALNEGQIGALPKSYQTAKPKDPNYERYLEKYGNTVWELDALTPTQLQGIVEDVIMEYRPISKIQQLKEQDEEDQNKMLELLKDYEGEE